MNDVCLIVKMHEEGIDGAVGRVLGIQLKDKIISSFDSGKYDRIILDFSKVDFITSGFAKELLGGLYENYRESFKQLVSVRVEKENTTLKNTIIRALATAIEAKK